MGYKIKDIIDITIYDKQTHQPILYIDDIDSTLELVGEEFIDSKFNNNHIYYSATIGDKIFEINGFLEVFS